MKMTVLMVALAATLAACSSSPPAAQQAAGASAGGASGATPVASYFSVPADQQSHLQVASAQTMSWETTVRTTGTVDWNNDHTTQAITQVSGPITRLVVDTGARVKTGDPLLYVASADITGAISTYRKAMNRLDLAQRIVTRDKDLLEHKAISQRDMESAQADLNDASTDLQSSLQALKILGVSEADLRAADEQGTPIRPELPMRAPLSGIIVQKMVLPGQFIQAGATAAFVISNMASVWVQAHVYEKDLTSVHVGDTVEVHSASYPQTFHGVVSNIGDFIDPATRTTSVRIVTQNPGGLLKKDMFVDVVIHDKASQEVLVVPTSSVLYDEDNMPFVYLQVEPGKFAQRAVTLGDQEGDNLQIVQGLKAGDPVVSQGSVFLQFASTYQQ